MRRLLGVIVALLCVASLSAQTTGHTSIQNFIEVTGYSDVTLTPDIFNISITIDEGDSKGRIAATKQQESMIKELQKIGVNIEEQLKLTTLNSKFEKRSEAYSAVGYTLKLTSTESLTAAFEIFDKLYISKVYLESAESSKLHEAKVEARNAAIINAQQAAQELATTLGQQLGNCFYIYDMSNDSSAANYTPRTIYYAASTNSSAPSTDSTPLEAKDIKFTYRVKAKFILEY